MAEYKGVRAKGNGIEIRWQHKSENYSLYIDETPTATGLTNAARYRKSLIESTKKGEYQTEQNNQPVTFKQCCNAMLKHKAKSVKQSTLDSYKSKLETYWHVFDKIYILDIKLRHLREIDRDTSWSHPKTRNNAISTLKQVFKFAMDEDVIDTDPSIKLRPVKYQKKEIDSFSRAEQEKILSALNGKYRLFYLLMFENGLRTGEAQALKWTDWKNDQLRVSRSIYRGGVTTTKTHQSRLVYLSPASIAELKAQQGIRFKSQWIISNKTKDENNKEIYLPYYSDNRLTVHFKKACEDAGVRYRRPYYCRHTYATNALTAGVSAIAVAKQIGDRLETMQRNYADIINAKTDKNELAKAHNWENAGKKEEDSS